LTALIFAADSLELMPSKITTTIPMLSRGNKFC
jgi:hypothetical protein